MSKKRIRKVRLHAAGAVKSRAYFDPILSRRARLALVYFILQGQQSIVPYHNGVHARFNTGLMCAHDSSVCLFVCFISSLTQSVDNTINHPFFLDNTINHLFFLEARALTTPTASHELQSFFHIRFPGTQVNDRHPYVLKLQL